MTVTFLSGMPCHFFFFFKCDSGMNLLMKTKAS